MSNPNANLPLVLPVVTIDPTFPSVIQDVFNGTIPSEEFWISCYKTSQPSVHAKIRAELDEINRDLVRFAPLKGNVEFRRDDHFCAYSVECRTLGISPTPVIAPTQQYSDQERSNPQRPQRISAFDVAPDSSKFAAGFLDGSVILYPVVGMDASVKAAVVPQDISTAISARTTSRPHLSTVTHLQFFPSSRVLLSAGADFSLTILPADLPLSPSSSGTRISPARTLRAHSRSITSTAIIGPGRNIVSTSLDSMLKLWDVSSGSVIHSLLAQSPITSSSLGDRTPSPPDGEEYVPLETKDDREVPEAQTKIIFCGLQNGTFEQLDLGSKSSVYRSKPDSLSFSLSCIKYSSEHNLLAAGSSSGTVTLYDTRSLGTPLTSFKRSDSGVEDLEFVSRGNGEIGLAIATSDGLPYIASVIPEGPSVYSELVGGDCDAVRNIEIRRFNEQTEIWIAGDDAIVRRYSLQYDL